MVNIRLSRILLVCSVTMLVLGGCSGKEEVLVTVDGAPITSGEFQKRVKDMLMQFKPGHDISSLTPQERATTEQFVMSQLIDKILFLNEAEHIGIKVGDDEVDMKIDFIKAQFPSDSEFEENLKERGISRGDFESDIHGMIMKEKLLQAKVENTVEITEEMVKAYYDDNRENFHRDEVIRLSQIVRKLPPDADQKETDRILKELKSIRAQIVEEDNFSQVANEHSEDQSAARGGDMGYLSREQLTPPLARAAFSLPAGSLGKPVRSRFGYHLLKVIDHREEGYIPYDEVKHQIREELWKQGVEREKEQYISVLRKNAEIAINTAKFRTHLPNFQTRQVSES